MKTKRKPTIKKLLTHIAAAGQNTTSSSVFYYHPTVPKELKKNDK